MAVIGDFRARLVLDFIVGHDALHGHVALMSREHGLDVGGAQLDRAIRQQCHVILIDAVRRPQVPPVQPGLVALQSVPNLLNVALQQLVKLPSVLTRRLFHRGVVSGSCDMELAQLLVVPLLLCVELLV